MTTLLSFQSQYTKVSMFESWRMRYLLVSKVGWNYSRETNFSSYSIDILYWSTGTGI